MKNTSTKIVFFGTEDFSAASLNRLIEDGFLVCAVVTKPDSKKGRGQKMAAPQVKILAEKNNIPVLQPNKLADIYNELKSLTPAVGVLVSYGKIIPQSVIDLFSPGVINVHPSLLPKYRGPSPIEAAIKNGDSKTGITIMQLSAKMDAGPIYTQETYSLSGDETKPFLYETLATNGANLLAASLHSILDGSLTPTAQKEEDATYCSLLQKTDTHLDLKTLTAAQAERTIRAYLGYPKTKVTVSGHEIIIKKAHITTEQKTPLDIACKDGAFLSIDELVAQSGRTMSNEQFLRGYELAG